MKTTKLLLPLAIGALACVTAAHANVSVTVWEGVNGNVSDWSIPTSPIPYAGSIGGTADITGTYSGLDFEFASPAAPYTIGGFLNSGVGTFNVTTGSANLGNTLLNTLFVFQGAMHVENGQQFTISSDDGCILSIDGITVLSAGEPDVNTAHTSTVWTGASGTYNFVLEYSETTGNLNTLNGAPADLSANLNSVPEPSTVVAGALLLLPFGVSTLRILRKKQIS